MVKGQRSKVDVDYSAIHNPTLYHHLLDRRKALASERHMPPAYIMNLKTIIGITNMQPRTPEELLAIPGIGNKTASEHGADLLEIVATHAR